MHQDTFKISCQLSAIITYYSLKVLKFLIYTTRALNQRDTKNIPNSAVPIQHFTPISFIKSFLVWQFPFFFSIERKEKTHSFLR